MRIIYYILIISILCTKTAFSQSDTHELSEFVLKENKLWKDTNSLISYYRTKYTVLKFRPLLDTINTLIKNIDSVLLVGNDNIAISFISEKEKSYKRLCSSYIKELSREDGKILLKLISRQTGQTCYELIKKYKGNGVARKWSIVAKINFIRINSKYNPNDDKIFEFIAKSVLY